MIAFFDTSVHIALLRGERSVDDVLARAPIGPVRLSPVVASELLRGASGRSRRAVDRLIDTMVSIEPPSWRAAFLETGRLLPLVWASHEEVGLARLQNDTLLAWTARHCGALLVSLDTHFATLQQHIPFRLLLLD